MSTYQINSSGTMSVRDGKHGLGLDRWIFVLMALLFLVTVLIGFIPSSIEKLAAIDAGQRAPFPGILHFHAVFMGAWILLLMTQASLVAANQRRLHQKLGLTALVLVPGMVVTGVILVPTIFRQVWALDPSVLAPQQIQETKTLISNIALGQIRGGILFPVFIGIALYYRRSDPGTHKRLMFLATLLPMPAAFDRITWLPVSLPASALTWEIYIVLWMLPLLIYDLLRTHQIHRAYKIWIAGYLPFMIATQMLWGNSWWLATVPKIMGVESW